MPILDENDNRACPAAPAARRRGFTLVELLVVITLLALLVAMTIAAARFVSDRASAGRVRANQAILWKAIQVYRDKNNAWPPGDPAHATIPGNDIDALSRGLSLYTQLAGAGGDVTILQGLTGSCVASVQLVDTYGNTVGGVTFVDSWGTFMDYQMAGGVGGTPVVISAGPDRKFNTPDDIRSDGKGAQ